MDLFRYQGGRLFAEDVEVERIAAQVGTPAYIYSKGTFLDHLHKMQEAYALLDTTICFSVKACGNIHILKLMAQQGSGFDIVSGGELYRVQQAGADLSKVVYAGVGKTDEEIVSALRAGIGCFNIESEQELENLSRLAAAARPGLEGQSERRVTGESGHRIPDPRLSDHRQEGHEVRRGHRAGHRGLREVRQKPVDPAEHDPRSPRQRRQDD